MGYGVGFGQFGQGFAVFEVIFAIIFIAFLAVCIAAVGKGIGEWNKNNQSPRLTVFAEIVSRRVDVTYHHHMDENNMWANHSSTWYYITFQVASGDRMEFLVSGKEYGMLSEGDKGELTFQGTRYLSFKRAI